MPAGGRRVDPRAAEYVDSVVTWARVRDGRRLIARIDGNYGVYRTELNLASTERGSCTCPSDEWPCKHIRALRATWFANPHSFLDLDAWLRELAHGGRGAPLTAMRTIVTAHPECLGALGVPGFEQEPDSEDGLQAEGLRATDSATPPTRPRFTPLQGQYLAFIHNYTQMHSRPPAEADLQRYFRVSPPSVHRMVIALETKGLVRRRPGQARSLRVLVRPDEVPDLGA